MVTLLLAQRPRSSGQHVTMSSFSELPSLRALLQHHVLFDSHSFLHDVVTVAWLYIKLPSALPGQATDLWPSRLGCHHTFLHGYTHSLIPCDRSSLRCYRAWPIMKLWHVFTSLACEINAYESFWSGNHQTKHKKGFLHKNSSNLSCGLSPTQQLAPLTDPLPRLPHNNLIHEATLWIKSQDRLGFPDLYRSQTR